jgi:transposase-like protein
MKKRQWTSERKLQIVMQGVKGRPVSEICNEYQIGQSQYYLWRDQFLQNAGKIFEMPKTAQQQTRLERENEKLKAMVGELTMELKKKRLVRHHRRRAVLRTLADALLLEQIRAIKSEHPFWGYRRVWAYLRFVARLAVNRKRVYRLLKENDLLVRADTCLLAKRVSNTRKPRPERVNQCAIRH